jgi:hypothetical protein
MAGVVHDGAPAAGLASLAAGGNRRGGAPAAELTVSAGPGVAAVLLIDLVLVH